MTKKIASISVKLLCLLMVFALAAGCRKSPGDSSSDYYTSEIIVDDDTSGSTSGGDGKGTDASGTTSDGSKASGTASTGNGKDKPNAGTTGGKVNPEKYRGTTVRSTELRLRSTPSPRAPMFRRLPVRLPQATRPIYSLITAHSRRQSPACSRLRQCSLI